MLDLISSTLIQDRMSKKPSHATVPLTFHYLSTYFSSCIAVMDSLRPFFPLVNGTQFIGRSYCTYNKYPLFLPLTQQKDLTSESSWLPREDDIYKILHKVVARLNRNNAQYSNIFDIYGNLVCLLIEYSNPSPGLKYKNSYLKRSLGSQRGTDIKKRMQQGHYCIL